MLGQEKNVWSKKNRGSRKMLGTIKIVSEKDFGPTTLINQQKCECKTILGTKQF